MDNEIIEDVHAAPTHEPCNKCRGRGKITKCGLKEYYSAECSACGGIGIVEVDNARRS